MDRFDAMTEAARRTGPFALLAVFLFGCAAFIEAFISPNGFDWISYFNITPLLFKQSVAWITGLLLFIYIVILGGISWYLDRRNKMLNVTVTLNKFSG